MKRFDVVNKEFVRFVVMMSKKRTFCVIFPEKWFRF